MEIKINTKLIEHEFLKLDSRFGVLLLEDSLIGIITYNKIERCVELMDELDEDVKNKLKSIIEKWVEDSRKVEIEKEQAEKKELNEKLRSILKL